MKIIKLKDIPQEGVSHNPEIMKQVIVKNGEIPHITNVSRSTFKPGQTADPHAHETMYEVTYVLKGEIEVTSNGQTQTAKENDTIIIPPKETHSMVNKSDQDATLFYFGIATDND